MKLLLLYLPLPASFFLHSSSLYKFHPLNLNKGYTPGIPAYSFKMPQHQLVCKKAQTRNGQGCTSVLSENKTGHLILLWYALISTWAHSGFPCSLPVAPTPAPIPTGFLGNHKEHLAMKHQFFLKTSQRSLMWRIYLYKSVWFWPFPSKATSSGPIGPRDL